MAGSTRDKAGTGLIIVAALGVIYLLHQQEVTAADDCKKYRPASVSEQWKSMGEDTPYWRCVNKSRYDQHH